jgi:hypothetical protein
MCNFVPFLRHDSAYVAASFLFLDVLKDECNYKDPSIG